MHKKYGAFTLAVLRRHATSRVHFELCGVWGKKTRNFNIFSGAGAHQSINKPHNGDGVCPLFTSCHSTSDRKMEKLCTTVGHCSNTTI